MKRLLLGLGFILVCLTGCTGVPKGIRPVTNFDAKKYLGTWYEIARLDHAFERDLSHVSATYSERDDGGIRVVNRGQNIQTGEVRAAEGRAYFMNGRDIGHLKVSFFGPFYGAYVVFRLDEKDYKYAFVAGYNRSFLWLLARKPKVDDAVRAEFIKTAKELGFATDDLIFVNQD